MLIEMRRGLKQGERVFRYDVVHAFYAGIHEHPLAVIKRMVPDARHARPDAGSWLFTGSAVSLPPGYLVDITRYWWGAVQDKV